MGSEDFVHHLYERSGVARCDLFRAAHSPYKEGYEFRAHSIIAAISVIEHDEKVTLIKAGNVCGKLANNHSIVCATALAATMRLPTVDAIGVCMSHEPATEEYL